MQLNKLRKEARFNKEIGGIINVLKGVASAEFYRLQKTRKRLDEFIEYLQNFFRLFDVTGWRHLFLEESSLPRALLLITSDMGFLGKLNMSVAAAALRQCSGNSLGEAPSPGVKDKFIIVGKQGVRYIEETGINFVSFPGISDEVSYEESEKLTDFIFRGFLNKEFGKMLIVYPHFVSFTSWHIQTYQLFPCRFLFGESSKPKSREQEQVIIEPGKTKVLEYLIKIWVNYILYGVFWESKLSEWAARIMHLEGSHYEIGQLDRRIRLQYFRLLHEKSDKNIREIFSSRLAIKGMG